MVFVSDHYSEEPQRQGTKRTRRQTYENRRVSLRTNPPIVNNLPRRNTRQSVQVASHDTKGKREEVVRIPAKKEHPSALPDTRTKHNEAAANLDGNQAEPAKCTKLNEATANPDSNQPEPAKTAKQNETAADLVVQPEPAKRTKQNEVAGNSNVKQQDGKSTSIGRKVDLSGIANSKVTNVEESKQNAELQKRYDQKSLECREEQRKLEEKTKEVDGLKRENDTLKEEGKKKDKEIEQIMEWREVQTAKVETLERQIEELKNDVQEKDQQCAKLQQQVEDQRREMSRLQQENDALKDEGLQKDEAIKQNVTWRQEVEAKICTQEELQEVIVELENKIVELDDKNKQEEEFERTLAKEDVLCGVQHDGGEPTAERVAQLEQENADLKASLTKAERAMAERTVGVAPVVDLMGATPADLERAIQHSYAELRNCSQKIFLAVKTKCGADRTLQLKSLFQRFESIDIGRLATKSMREMKWAVLALLATCAFEHFETESFQPGRSSGMRPRCERRAFFGERYARERLKESSCAEENEYIHERSKRIVEMVQGAMPGSNLRDVLQPLGVEIEAGLRAVWELHTLSRAFEVPPEIIRCHVGASCSDASVELVDDSYENVTNVASWVFPGFRLCGHERVWSCKVVPFDGSN